MTVKTKSFLVLQGSYSRFTRRLGETLAARGHEVAKVHFCGGDRYFWGDWRALAYNGNQEGLPAFYRDIFAARGVTDLILFADCRPAHRPAIELAEASGVNVHVLEEGYMRPHWITLEWGGMAGYSYLSTQPEWYREKAACLPDLPPAEPVGGSMSSRVISDLANNFAYYAGRPFYPHYRTHRPYEPLNEYCCWLKRLAAWPFSACHAVRTTRRLLDRKEKFFIFPLQLDSDVQIRVHSSFRGMVPVVDAVIRSFSLHAPADTKLLIKSHPLDEGVIDYRALTRKIAEEYGVASRVLFIDGGDLAFLKRHAQGMVVVNSTSGFAAIGAGHPVIALGKAIYDLPGLTFQGSLDEFWTTSFLPDMELLAAFRKVAFSYVMANGNFYTQRGMDLAIANSVPRLERVGCPFGELPPAPLREAPMPHRVAFTPEVVAAAAQAGRTGGRDFVASCAHELRASSGGEQP